MTDRRRESRERQPWQPHPDQIASCVGVWEFYKDSNMPLEDKIRRVIVEAKAWADRDYAEDERAKKAYIRASVNRVRQERQEIVWNTAVRAAKAKPFDPDACGIHDSDTDPGGIK